MLRGHVGVGGYVVLNCFVVGAAVKTSRLTCMWNNRWNNRW